MGSFHELTLCNELGDEPAFAVCHDIQLTADGKLPEWIQLVPAGEKIEALDGRKFSNAEPQAIVDAFNADPRDIPLDWEHATEIKAPNGERAPAAAWIDKIEVRNGGEIWGHIKEWNPDGARDIENKSYRYISPAFLFKKASRIIAKIVSAALVNRPALNMPSIAREDYYQDPELCAVWTTKYINDLPDSAFLYIEKGGEKDKDGKTVPRALRHFPYKDANGKIDLPHLRNAIARIPQAKIPELDAAALKRLQERARQLLEKAQRANAQEEVMDREKLIAELGLAKDATDEQIFAALRKLKTDPAEELKKVQDDLATEKASHEATKTELANARAASPSLTEYVPRSQHDAVVSNFNSLKAEVEDGKKKDREKAVASAIDDALKAGKIVPASKDQYTAMCSSEEGFKQFQELVKTLPVIGDPTTLDRRDPPRPTPGGTEITAEEKEIAAQFGMTTEEYIKQRGEAIAEATGAH